MRDIETQRAPRRAMAVLFATGLLAGCTGPASHGVPAGAAPESGPGPTGTVDPPPAPVIAAFAAQPASIAPGASSTLSWSVSGATSLAIDRGVGTVTGTSASVRPAATTTYTLTATNAGGTATARASVTVAAGGATGICNNASTQLFPPGAPWNQAVDGAPLDAESDAIISYLQTNHTSSSRFQITFDFNVLFADANTPHRAFSATSDFFSPDCDPAPVPVPASGRLEGESDYACASNGDCHLTVVDSSTCRLHELWRANLAGGTSTGTFTSGCQAIWDLSSVPPPTERGDFCTSADAAGLPIVPLVFTADEVAAGTVDHAIRFILPNSLIRAHVFVRPGTHSPPATSGGSTAPPYATRVRLKASKDISTLSTGAQVIARALKKYGMILADGGNVTFTAATDALTAHKWSAVGVSSGSLKGLSWSDFEVVDLGTRIDARTGDCMRTPITQ
jgi:serine/threonine-protein kinase